MGNRCASPLLEEELKYATDGGESCAVFCYHDSSHPLPAHVLALQPQMPDACSMRIINIDDFSHAADWRTNLDFYGVPAAAQLPLVVFHGSGRFLYPISSIDGTGCQDPTAFHAQFVSSYAGALPPGRCPSQRYPFIDKFTSSSKPRASGLPGQRAP
eukprot:TRINITY_DN3666_c0_g1_i2.p1 TRINITY_DN3666_c0_g1~~TRINITY_DN3666_c0_g1_i2.p1  ORF type:complete len:157 (-),score=10.74 TRINITY_DN3666_c0_g1_i2:416-886(-)